MTDNKSINLMSDSLFKALIRSSEARGMISSVISDVTDIEKEKIINAKFVGGDIPKQNKKEKGKVSDIIIYLENDVIIVLEMNQYLTGENFKKNNSYVYSIYSQNIRVENEKTIYPKLYLININNFNEYDTKEAIQYFDFKDQNDVLETMEGCKSIHLVLANIIDTRYNNGISDKVIRFSKFLRAKSIDEIKEIVKGDEEFMESSKKVEKLMRDRELIGLYDYEEKERLERKAIERYGEAKGHKKGLEEGIVLGRIEGRKEGQEEGIEQGLEQGLVQGTNIERRSTIQAMIENNFTIPQIAKIYKMTQNEISNYLHN